MKESWKRKRLCFVLASVLEIVSVGGYMYAVFYKVEWMRGTFALLACIPVMILAFDTGIVSKIMGCKPFLWFGVIQFEFYILHQSVINLTQKYVQPYVENNWVRAVIAFVMIGVLAYFYQTFSEQVVVKYFEKYVEQSRKRNNGEISGK